jgi:hypothetical protein
MTKINKNKNFLLVSMVCVVAFVLSCQPENDFPELKNPLAIKPALLEGSWKVAKVTQYDQEALDNGYPSDVQSREITDAFPFSEYQIEFMLDESGRPANYKITPGSAPNFLKLNEGKWSVNDPVFATEIRMTSPTDPNTASFKIKKLSENVIQLQVLRKDAADGTLYSFYEYEFVKL